VKLGIAGKGGSGKTTIAGTLARLLVEQGNQVLAIDGDLNPNLGLTLGLQPTDFDAGKPLTHDVLDHREVDGKSVAVLSRPLDDILREFALDAPGGIRLLIMGRPEEAGFG
jgi:CO dehydrogenase maturation factor